MTDLKAIAAELNSVTDLVEFFGDDPNVIIRRFKKALHPDQIVRQFGEGAPEIAEAVELWTKFEQLEAESKRPVAILKSKKHEYSLGTRLYRGDVSDIYFATAKGEPHQYMVKSSRVVGADALLRQEDEVLKAVHKAAGDKNYRHYFPLPVESFKVSDRIQKQVNVFHYQDQFYTLEQIREKYPDGLNPRHLGWIFKRVLTALGFLHQREYVHGAVLPCHIMLSPTDHGGRLIGFGQSVKIGQVVKHAVQKYRDWYPHEILNKQPVQVATDIYLAAKSMLYLGGADMKTNVLPATPKATIAADRMTRFLQSCLLGSVNLRPSDAWALQDEWDEMLRSLFGPPKFIPLLVP